MKILLGEICEFFDINPQYKNDIEVNTRHGYKKIENGAITAIDSKVYELRTSCGKNLKGSPDHLLYVNNKWTKLKDINENDIIETIHGDSRVLECNLLDYTDTLYDIQVSEVKEFYANGIVSHNSTITDVISFVLFGKPIRKNKKGNIVNRINKKALLTEIKFNIDNVLHYKVIRGLKPDVFDIYENDVLLPRPARDADHQKYLEDKILRMNFITFTQSIVVSKTLYEPFMQLKTPRRREFVESVLRLKVFSNMSKLHSDKLKKVKAEFNTIKYDNDKLEIEVENAAESLETLERVLENSTKEKADYINTKLEENDVKINDLVKEHNVIKSKLVEVDNTINSKYTTNQKALVRLNDKLADTEDALSKVDLSENVCTMCGHELTTDHREEHKKNLSDQIDKLKDGIKKVEDLLSELEPQVKINEQLELDNQNCKNEMTGIQRILQSLSTEKKSLQSELSNISVDTTELDTVREKLYNVSQQKQEKQIEFDTITKKLEYCNLVATMLKDNGIKASIVEKSIPLINKLINQNLSKFGFFAKFELDSEFNEKILLRGFQEASYHDFSEGEKLRIDMAILLAWREITMLQNAMFCNVLFLDEMTDASLDDEGIAIFSNMLTCLKDNNVFVITHKPEKLENIARSRIIIEKVDGYSRIAQ